MDKNIGSRSFVCSKNYIHHNRETVNNLGGIYYGYCINGINRMRNDSQRRLAGRKRRKRYSLNNASYLFFIETQTNIFQNKEEKVMGFYLLKCYIMWGLIVLAVQFVFREKKLKALFNQYKEDHKSWHWILVVLFMVIAWPKTYHDVRRIKLDKQ